MGGLPCLGGQNNDVKGWEGLLRRCFGGCLPTTNHSVQPVSKIPLSLIMEKAVACVVNAKNNNKKRTCVNSQLEAKMEILIFTKCCKGDPACIKLGLEV